MVYLEEEDKVAISKKRIAIMGFSAILLVTIVVAVTFGVRMQKNHSHKQAITSQANASTKAIQAICKPTDFKQECINFITPSAGTVTDPAQLIKISVDATIKQIFVAANKTNAYFKAEKDKRAADALDTCKELFGVAVQMLDQVSRKLGDFNDFAMSQQMFMDLVVWDSAAMSCQEHCLDGFPNITSSVGEQMITELQTPLRLSINNLQMLLSTFEPPPEPHSRRLLSFDGLPVLGHGDRDFPKWYEPRVRKLLAEGAAEASILRKPDAFVAKDGSGSYKTINEALAHVPNNGTNTFMIYISEGIYNETLLVTKNMTNVLMIGDGPDKTRITGDKNFIDGTPAYRTATVAIEGDHFIAMEIGIENSAGPEKYQAIALRASSDQSVFYRCSIEGYQSTLYTHIQRQFFRDCNISGTIDIVSGDGSASFQNCTFFIRKPLPNQSCYVTASARMHPRQPSAIVIQNSTISGDLAYLAVKKVNKAYLGRPWKRYARSLVMESYIDDVIQPEGWTEYQGITGTYSSLFAEYKNTGPGANTTGRVKWNSVKKIDQRRAAKYGPLGLFGGDGWLNISGVPYSPALIEQDV